MIPQTFIQELLARVDIVDVVGRHVKLRKAGANFLGLCPFHGEKTPSFTVSPTKQFYHCFGCGAHGSAIGFLMEHGGLGYVDAIEELAKSAGLSVPHEVGAPGDRKAPALLEWIAQAARHYRQRLKDSPQAIDYLKRRGLAGQTAARYAIGYAPAQWRGLEAAVADYDAEEMVIAGLVIDAPAEGEQGRRKRYDRFRDRIMFPIRNARGQVLGFGGRVLDRSEPKYLNSPETPVFSKGRELYGLYEARDAIRDKDCVIVVEGYMDVVMLAQHGVGNVVATLGTATTAEHIRKLLRLVERIVFAFDGDAAGRKAAWRALEASLSQTDDTRRIEFLFLPPEHDPDSFVRERGAEAFREALAGALPLSELLLRELCERVDLATPEGRARLLAEAKPLLQALAAPGLRLQIVHRLGELAQLSPQEVERYLGVGAGGGRGAGSGRSVRSGHGVEPGSGSWPHERATGAGAGVRAEGAAYETGAARPRRASPPIQAGKPDLEQRLRWLAALHPALAGVSAETLAAEWMPAPLALWLRTIAALPPGATMANVCEALRSDDSQSVARLEREAASDASALAALSIDEARAEFDAALEKLHDRHLRDLSRKSAETGMTSPEERQRYQLLMAKRRRT